MFEWLWSAQISYVEDLLKDHLIDWTQVLSRSIFRFKRIHLVSCWIRKVLPKVDRDIKSPNGLILEHLIAKKNGIIFEKSRKFGLAMELAKQLKSFVDIIDVTCCQKQVHSAHVVWCPLRIKQQLILLSKSLMQSTTTIKLTQTVGNLQ